MGTFLEASESTGKVLKAQYHTLGCKLNFAETSTIGKLLAERSVCRAKTGETPDIIVVNTCSVTEMADKKARSLIRRLHRAYPEAVIVVTGCYAQLKPTEISEIEGVNVVLGSNEKLHIAEYLDTWIARKRDESYGNTGLEDMSLTTVTPFREIREFSSSCERGDRTRFFLKVQDGCDYFCTYCTIPFARGMSRSPMISDLVRQVRNEVVSSGGKEIVLTGVNTGDFGRNNGEDFFSLIRELDRIENIERYRISSIEPNLITPEMIDWIAMESRAFMPHFHIPLQSGSDAVLKLMNRRYDTELFASRINYIRKHMPDAFIGVDIIAGARGETEEEWHKTLEFVKSLPVTRFHIFPYSERPGTKALLLGGEVAKEIRHRRVAELQEISDAKLRGFMQQAVGSVRKVLWEHPVVDKGRKIGLMSGLTDNYLRVVAKGDASLVNTVTNCVLEEIDTTRPETMRGTVITKTGSENKE